MLNRERFGAVRVALVVALGTIGLAMACRQPPTCDICRMRIPADTGAIVLDGTRRLRVCDPRCALTHQEQTGKRVVLSVVTEFDTGLRLDPRNAVFVTGSDLAPDAHTAAVRTSASDEAHLHWHRCLPSVLAFRSLDAANRFQQRHGGTVVRFEQLGFASNP